MEVADVVRFLLPMQPLAREKNDFGTTALTSAFSTYCDGVVSAERTEADREDILADVGSDAILGRGDFDMASATPTLGVGEEGRATVDIIKYAGKVQVAVDAYV